MKKICLILALGGIILTGYSQDLKSPDGRLEIIFKSDQDLSFKVFDRGDKLLSAALSGLTGDDGSVISFSGKINSSQNSFDKTIIPEIPEKNSEIRDLYNELVLTINPEWEVQFRIYDNGWAYRFAYTGKESIKVFDEPFELEFIKGDSLLGMRESGFRTSYERPYVKTALDRDTLESLYSLPALVLKAGGERIWIGESGLENYPNLFLAKTEDGKLVSRYPKFPESESFEGGPYGWGRIKSEFDHIAEIDGRQELPWRVFAYSREDKELLSNQLVYQMAPECRIDDTSWIEPGWVILDWWARRNIHGVDFVSGSNTETAKHFINFCADFGIEYFLFDDGWSELQDLFKINPNLDMKEVMAYAEEKDVKVLMWVHWNALRKDMEKVLDMFEDWGIAGIKVDFMNRSDQEMVRFYWDVARETAERHMVVNFHGAYKPTGLRRAYPNVLTREGLIEFEYSGGGDYADPVHHNILPFLRNVAGPMDYIPGTMINATKANFRPVGNMPMGMGTRAHSIALAVICESPMQMIPDAPNEYYENEECARFLLDIPTVWDETIPLKTKIGDHTILARRSGDIWYLSGITDWDPAAFEVVPDFLPEGEYEIELIRDGINADKRAVDYVKENIRIKSSDTIKMQMAPGGGWIGRIRPKT
jgi:alpha-glucosidase